MGAGRLWRRWPVAQLQAGLTQERHLPIAERAGLYRSGVLLVLRRAAPLPCGGTPTRLTAAVRVSVWRSPPASQSRATRPGLSGVHCSSAWSYRWSPCARPLLSLWQSACSSRAKPWGSGCAAWSVPLSRRATLRVPRVALEWLLNPAQGSVCGLPPRRARTRGPGVQKGSHTGHARAILGGPACPAPLRLGRSAPSRLEPLRRFTPLDAHSREQSTLCARRPSGG